MTVLIHVYLLVKFGFSLKKNKINTLVYILQNLASFANVASGFMPLGAAGFMPMSMFGAAAGAPPAFRGGPPPVFLGAPGASAAAFLGAPPAPSAPPSLYDLDATALQNQLAAQFTQATPQVR